MGLNLSDPPLRCTLHLLREEMQRNANLAGRVADCVANATQEIRGIAGDFWGNATWMQRECNATPENDMQRSFATQIVTKNATNLDLPAAVKFNWAGDDTKNAT
jgi:hypothetical protein